MMTTDTEWSQILRDEPGRLGNDEASIDRMDKTYFTAEEAADYLRTTVGGIYGRVERGTLEKCPGSRRLLFTKEMLDDSVMGRTTARGKNAGNLRPGRRPKGEILPKEKAA